jgi:starch phosphorylase
VLDGWWIEGYDGWNGFGWTGYGDDRDAVAELALLEHAMNLRNTVGWWQMVSHAYLTLAPKFSSVRMFRDYIHYIYDILPLAVE